MCLYVLLIKLQLSETSTEGLQQADPTDWTYDWPNEMSNRRASINHDQKQNWKATSVPSSYSCRKYHIFPLSNSAPTNHNILKRNSNKHRIAQTEINRTSDRIHQELNHSSDKSHLKRKSTANRMQIMYHQPLNHQSNVIKCKTETRALYY